MEHWYPDERVNAMSSTEFIGPLEVVAQNLSTKRGELRLVGRGAKVRAFVKKVRFFFSNFCVTLLCTVIAKVRIERRRSSDFCNYRAQLSCVTFVCTVIAKVRIERRHSYEQLCYAGPVSNFCNCRAA